MTRRAVAFALWIVAALCAGTLALGSTPAFACLGPHHYAPSMAGAAAKTTTASAMLDGAAQSTRETQTALGAGIRQSQAVTVFFDGNCPDHCDRGGAHGLGCGCCASVCVIAAHDPYSRPDGGGRRLPVTPPLPMTGVSPTSPLDPPIFHG